ncbi:hypothetical protein AWC38_SpisGene20363 [Stylophora pistillata]|uniref:Uncharacterized protein n=1 Tax=Stylophora pistillata TaxID=50429 RepID=A0A2B4RGB4_STYPI|nr:hypothetical protein AWC38_SpisGene20363 [Stylophora pistillata]
MHCWQEKPPGIFPTGRFDIQEEHLVQLKTFVEEYYRINVLFLPISVNPTIWTISHVVPVHAKQVLNKYQQGLFTVTMEGRQAKHIASQRLSVNTIHTRKDAYSPQRVFNEKAYCYCGLHKAHLTDESCSFCSDKLMDLISASVRERKTVSDKFPQLELFHSLDIWHKAKKLSKCIHHAARVKGCESLKEWIDDIVSHYWFCCQNCEGHVGELKEVWFGVLHHVCGEHKWAEGECRHSPEETPSNGMTYLTKSSKALAAIIKVVLDKKWLSNLAFYVRFRGQQLNAAGEERGHRKYSKCTQKFHEETVKEEKGYSYFPFPMAKMFKEHCLLMGSFSQKTDHNVFNPKQIAPTIAMKATPSAEKLMKGHLVLLSRL